MEAVEKKLLEELSTKINEVKKSLDEPVSKSSIVLMNNNQNYKTNYNILTSLSRLLSLKEVCGCLYYKNDQEKIFVSTNKLEKPRNNKQIKREEIGTMIYNVIKNGFKMEDKAELYKKVYDGKVYLFSKKSLLTSHIQSSSTSDSTKSLSSLLSSVHDTWQDISREKTGSIKPLNILKFSLQRKIENEYSSISKAIIKEAVKVLTYLTDLEEVFKLEKGDTKIQNLVKKSILRQKGSWSQRYESQIEKIIKEELSSIDKKNLSHNDKKKQLMKLGGDLHAELSCVERENKQEKLETVTQEISIASKNGFFAVSKILCLICNKFFDSLEEAYKEKNKQEKSNHENFFEKLGGSMICYPYCRSPLIENGNFGKVVKKILEGKLEEVKEKISLVAENEKIEVESIPGEYRNYLIDENSNHIFIVVEDNNI